MKMRVYSPAGEAVAIRKDKGITAKPRDLIKFAKADKLWSKQGGEEVICVTKHNVFRFKVAQFVDRKLI